MTSHMKTLEMEIVNLKEDNKELTKHSGQKKVDEQISTAESLKICTYPRIVNYCLLNL